MFLDLNRLQGGRLHAGFRIESGNPILGGLEAEIREPLDLDIDLHNPSSRTYVLKGRLRGAVYAPCRRCLDPVAVPLDHTFRLVCQEVGRDAERDEEPGDDDIVWLKRGADRIEIDEEMRDRLFLEVDRFPLCREDCKGLCPVCGQNWNEGPCGCDLKNVDTRWKALEGVDFGDGPGG